MASHTETELAREVKELRQLLQAGLMLASAVLGGDDVRDDLQEWVEEVAATVARS